MTTATADSIKTMKLYTNVDRVFNELHAMGIGPNDPIKVEDLVRFDQYHYEGTDAVAHAIERCELRRDDHVLEVGSGIGGPARYMAHTAGCAVTALELQPDLHETAAQLTAQCDLTALVQHEQGDFLDEALPLAGYDALVSWLAFLHIPTRQQLFARCMAALKPGGALFIEDFFQRSEFSQEEIADLQSKVYCTYLPTQDEYIAQVAAAGFEEIQVEDMTARWRHFVQSRLHGFRIKRKRHLQVHGPEIVAGLDEFYATMTKLFAGGNLGGLRLVATKPAHAQRTN